MLDHEPGAAGAGPTLDRRTQSQADLALVRASATGSAAEIDALVARLRCVPRMMRAENARAGHAIGCHDLADVIQDTLLVTWSKLDRFAGTGPLEAWVHRICKLEFLNALRKRRRIAAQTCSWSVEPAAEADLQLDTLRRERVQQALRLLDGVDAEVVRQRFWQGLDFDVMARRGGVSVAAMKARFYRALRRLQQFLTLLERLDAEQVRSV